MKRNEGRACHGFIGFVCSYQLVRSEHGVLSIFSVFFKSQKCCFTPLLNLKKLIENQVFLGAAGFEEAS